MMVDRMQRYLALSLPLLAFGAIALASERQTLSSQLDRRDGFVDSEFAYLAARLHTGAIEISKLEESRGRSPAIKALAAKIRDGQEHVRPLLSQHAKNAANNPAIAAIDRQMQDAHQQAMTRMKAARGATIDREFVVEMIRVHDTMLQLLKRSRIADPALKTLANRIGTEHSDELVELRRFQSK
jgi:uncharacterized protein (DUF305 family)